MADEADGDAAAKKKLDPKTLLLGLLLVGGAAWFFLLRPAPVDPAEAAAAAAEAAEAPPVEGEIVQVEVMTVNLSSPELSFARLGVALVLAENGVSDDVLPRMALFRDAAISEIAQWGPDDLRTPAGHQLLRDGLTAVADEVWADGEVLRVVLTELLVQ